MAQSLEIVKEKGAITGGVECVAERVKMWLNTATNGTYTLTLQRATAKRSISQNALMWVWFTAIAQAWSEATDRVFTAQDVHDAYCLTLLPIDTPKGRIAGRTSGLSKDEMADFLNRVQVDAATEYGITLLNPEDKFFNDWAAEYQ